ncbi:MAG: hypothetical protein K6A36_00100 [Paludibacteraceae bacterium]|nr:hypothetical protein [Paludibacteraceae bacterium]
MAGCGERFIGPKLPKKIKKKSKKRLIFLKSQKLSKIRKKVGEWEKGRKLGGGFDPPGKEERRPR